MKKKQYLIFKDSFRELNHGILSLPKSLKEGIIYEVETYTMGNRGYYGARFFISKNEDQEYFLDTHGSCDDYSWHKRINSNGEIIKLESFEEFAWPVYDDPEKTKATHNDRIKHNERVQELLINKGLLRDPNNVIVKEVTKYKNDDSLWSNR